MSRKGALSKQAATSKEPEINVIDEAKKYEPVRVNSSSLDSNFPSPVASIRCPFLVVNDEAQLATSDDNKPDWGRALSHDDDDRLRQQRQLQAGPRAASQESLKGNSGGGGGGSGSQMARRLGSFSKNFLHNPFSPLRPSISTSCLFTTAATSPPPSAAGDQQSKQQQQQATASNNAVTLVCVPTRASLTHQWRKLKTLNKCRECDMLVYFNGRECSQCGFVAHKKCMTSLVIKCDNRNMYRELDSEKQQQQQHHQPTTWPAVHSLLDPLRVATASASPTLLDFEHKHQVRHESTRRSATAATQPIFGKPIPSTDTSQVLDFINRFVYEIDTRGLSSKGIYRVSSIKSKVDKLCHYFDHNPSQLIDLSSFHPNIIANALKLYLRRLPEPLLTNELYGRFIEVAKQHSHQSQQQQQQQLIPRPSTPDYPTTTTSRSYLSSSSARPIVRSLTSDDPNQQQAGSLCVTLANCSWEQPNEGILEEFRCIVSSLPPVNRNILALIMRHLRRVADMADENQMSAKNLSIIFGPTLLNVGGGQQQDGKSSSLAIVNNIHQAHAIELMITWAYQIFPEDP